MINDTGEDTNVKLLDLSAIEDIGAQFVDAELSDRLALFVEYLRFCLQLKKLDTWCKN